MQPTKTQQALDAGVSVTRLQTELHQIAFETFEVEDLVTSEQSNLGSQPYTVCSSCNSCFTTSCCSSSCSTTAAD